jgi:DNA polymerase
MRESLADILRDMGNCQRCKLGATRTNLVFGEGDAKARLMFVGEGPGADEDRSGRPFVGKAGQLLNKMIAAMGLKREQVYIANIVKSRPPNNRDPEADEIAACLPFLQRQIRAIMPEVIVTLGKPAARTLLKLDGSISVYRGVWQRYEGIEALPTFHPAYLLRNPADKKHAWADLQAVMRRLGLTPPSGA